MAILVLAIASLVGYNAANTVPGREYYDLKAELTAADNLSNHYEVRIGGLRAGQILNPRVKDGRALVDIRLDKRFAPLRSDSSLQVRLRSAVGVRYLEITPGTKGRILKPGELLPARTQTANVSLDQTLGTLDPATRRKTQALLRELGAGAADNGADVNLALEKLAPLMRDVQTLAKPLVARPGITRRLVREAAGATGALDGVRQTLASMFDPARRALEPLATGAPDVGRTLDAATQTMDALRDDLPGGLNTLAPTLGDALTTAHPTLRQAPAALREATRLLRGSRPALRRATSTLRLAKVAVDPTIATLQTLEPQLPRIDTLSTASKPLLAQLAEHKCALTHFAQGWGEWLKYGSPRANYIRFYIAFHVPEELAGDSGHRLPGPDGKPLLSHNIRVNPYPGPCVGAEGEVGKDFPRVEESAKGLVYSKSFPVIR